MVMRRIRMMKVAVIMMALLIMALARIIRRWI